MNIEDKKNVLELLQKFFLKSFVWSFVLMIIASLLCVLMHDFQIKIVESLFDVDTEALNSIILLVFAFWKVLIIQFTLVPALVIWCMRNCVKCNNNYKD